MNHPRSRARRRELNKYFSTPRDAFGNMMKTKDKYAPNVLSTPYCPACKKEKIQFSSESEALLFIKYNADRIKEQKGHAPIRAYECPICGCCHITSQEKRNKKIA